jgi:hypothetical protein
MNKSSDTSAGEMNVSMILESISMYAPPIKGAMRRSLGLLLAYSTCSGVAFGLIAFTSPTAGLRGSVTMFGSTRVVGLAQAHSPVG